MEPMECKFFTPTCWWAFKKCPNFQKQDVYTGKHHWMNDPNTCHWFVGWTSKPVCGRS